MNRKLFEALEALCGMWEQYCGDSTGHCFMSAGEEAQEVLDKYQLLKNDTGTGGIVDWDRLEVLRADMVNSEQEAQASVASKDEQRTEP